MRRAVIRAFERKSMTVRIQGEALGRRMVSFHTAREAKLNALTTRMRTLAEYKVKDAEGRVTALSGKLDAALDCKVLSRGYFSVTAAGKSVTSVRTLKRGDILEGRGGDGTFMAEVTDVRPD